MTFRLYKLKLRFGFGFFAIPAFMLCFESGVHFLPAMLAYCIHELGHIAAAEICGMEITEIRFGALGIRMTGNAHRVAPLRRAVVSLAGPMINFLFFVLLLPMGVKWYAPQLLLFVFHILPAVPLDGGTALFCVLRCAFTERTARLWCIAISAVLSFLLGVLGFAVLLRSKGNFSLLIAAIYIMFYILIKQREDLL